jgi:dephospho-CoA kinase
MIVIGLTGGIASGKSTVSRMLTELGAEVIDADKIAREIVEPGTETLRKLVDSFGPWILNPDGTLDRKALGQEAFNNPEKLNLLNRITHPEIRRIVKERIFDIKRRCGDKIIVVDAAVLLESGMNDLVDEIWLVYVDHDTQIKRLMDRNNLTLDEAEVRIKSQMPFEEKIKYSHRVIDNSMDLVYTNEQVKKVWNYLKNNGGRPVAP